MTYLHKLKDEKTASIVHAITHGRNRGHHTSTDKTYMDLIQFVLARGIYSENRTGIDTIVTFGTQERYNAFNLPILTTKRIHMKSVIGELVWFLKGDTNVKFLQDNGITIWDEWADDTGELGPVYGSQWRNFNGVDQINRLVNDIANNPTSRRHIVTAWNPATVNECKLPPCHVMWQIDANQNSGAMSLMLTQRSLDLFLGAPFNILSYSLLLHIICNEVNTRLGDKKYFPKELIHSVANTHIYVNHIEPLFEQWQRHSLDNEVSVDLTGFLMNRPSIENIKINGYTHFHPSIAGAVAV